jgi:hypothetical protein
MYHPITGLLAAVDEERLRRTVFYLAADPLPFRKLCYTVPGRDRNTLYEADDYLAGQLEEAGYTVARSPHTVRCFGYDASLPLHHRYTRPTPEAPEYTAFNLSARRRGGKLPGETLVLLAHKDSQSWVDSPGAYDNATGTAAVVELARILAGVALRRSLWILFCNEEHTPWTSVAAAEDARQRGERLTAVFNLDSLGGKPDTDIAAGRKTNVTLYTEPEGLRVAEAVTAAVERFNLPLEQRICRRARPGDDDGSFIRAGFPAAVANLGSWPYGDSQYHLPGDRPERVDFENVRLAAQASLAALLLLDAE